MILIVKALVFIIIYGIRFMKIVYGWLGMLLKFCNEFGFQIGRSDMVFLV